MHDPAPGPSAPDLQATFAGKPDPIRRPFPVPGTILILDHGSQYTQLIARRVRELNVYCEIHPFSKAQQFANDPNIEGVILSGSPSSVHEPNAPDTDLTGHAWARCPCWRVCYGAQLLAKRAGAPVERSNVREYGRAHLSTISESHLFDGIEAGTQVWMSHGDTITAPSEAMEVIASTKDVPVAAFRLLDGHDLRRAVPPRGVPYHGRPATAAQLRHRHLRLRQATGPRTASWTIPWSA